MLRHMRQSLRAELGCVTAEVGQREDGPLRLLALLDQTERDQRCAGRASRVSSRRGEGSSDSVGEVGRDIATGSFRVLHGSTWGRVALRCLRTERELPAICGESLRYAQACAPQKARRTARYAQVLHSPTWRADRPRRVERLADGTVRPASSAPSSTSAPRSSANAPSSPARRTACAPRWRGSRRAWRRSTRCAPGLDDLAPRGERAAAATRRGERERRAACAPDAATRARRAASPPATGRAPCAAPPSARRRRAARRRRPRCAALQGVVRPPHPRGL